MYCDQCAKTEAELKRVCLELARVREDLKAWERNCASLIAHRDEALEKVERVARRAAEFAYYEAELAGRKIVDAIVAQAMREEG